MTYSSCGERAHIIAPNLTELHTHVTYEMCSQDSPWVAEV